MVRCERSQVGSETHHRWRVLGARHSESCAKSGQLIGQAVASNFVHCDHGNEQSHFRYWRKYVTACYADPT